jgi:hypothetical protein
MLRTCEHCGATRETKSVRSRYYCAASKCQQASRVRGDRHGPNKLRQTYYWKRWAKLKRRRIRKGLSPDIYGV